eukprot:jgi/Chlat1/4693/Chrsp3S05628
MQTSGGSTAVGGEAMEEVRGSAGGGDAAEELRDGREEAVMVEQRGDHSAVCRWTLAGFSRVKARALWSRYFAVGGYDCRLLVYPRGDSQALPGYLSVYLQVTDPRGASAKWDCFASYRLCIVNQRDDSKSIQRDSWHRFSGKKKSHGWCDFTPASALLDARSGFLVNDGLLITAEILLLHESIQFSREPEPSSSGLGVATSNTVPSESLGGKFTWRVHNLPLFKEMIKTQKIMSPVFPAGECNLRLSVYQSSVSSVEYLSMCLESKDTDKSSQVSANGSANERSCWCLFRMSVLNQGGKNHMHRDSYGRFAADNKSGDNTSLGWNDYMKMSDFLAAESGYLAEDGTAVFCASFHIIREHSSTSKTLSGHIPRAPTSKKHGGEIYQGKFVWRIDNFTKLKDLLKKRKITGLCIKSRRFQVGGRDCRLIVYPRGQSQPPCHLSMFLEVTDPRASEKEWSCFVSHKLSVVNQKAEERSVSKESQNRYSKAAKDWGWREFVTLTSLFDQDAGFLVNDACVFSAEVLILKETAEVLTLKDTSAFGEQCFTWRVENFMAFKDIMETRKIFSKYFLAAGSCELRIGVYESFDTLCIYLESDGNAGLPDNQLDKNYWVRYRIAVVNQRHPERTAWKESSICTRTWNNSVLQFMKVSDLLEADAGFLVRDTVVFTCEVLDCCPWFDFADLDGLAGSSDDEPDVLSTDPEELLDDDSEEDDSEDDLHEDLNEPQEIFRSLLARAGFSLGGYSGEQDGAPALLDPSQLQAALRERLLMDAGAVAAFLAGLRVYLDDPARVRRLLLPTVTPSRSGSGLHLSEEDDDELPLDVEEDTSPSVMHLLMGVKVLQQAIVDLLLDIMLECCTKRTAPAAEDARSPSASSQATREHPQARVRSSSTTSTHDYCDAARISRNSDTCSSSNDAMRSDATSLPYLPTGVDCMRVRGDASAVTSSTSNALPPPLPPPPPARSSQSHSMAPGGDHLHSPSGKTLPRWPEQPDELLGLIVDSLRALDNGVAPMPSAVGCSEPRRRPQSASKVAAILASAPTHLQRDIAALVPKLVDPLEHPAVAGALLERMHAASPGDLPLRMTLLCSLAQLHLPPGPLPGFSQGAGADTIALTTALEVLPWYESEAELAAVIALLLRAAAAADRSTRTAMVRAVRTQLKRTGGSVRVLAVVGFALCTPPWEVAQAMLREIEADGSALENEQEQDLNSHRFERVSDVAMLLDLMAADAAPPHTQREAERVFEAAVAHGGLDEQTIVMVLERRRAQHQHHYQHIHQQYHQLQDYDFPAVLRLAEVLAQSVEPRVREFVRSLYVVLFKLYSSDACRDRILHGLVDKVTRCLEGAATPQQLQMLHNEAELGMEILAFLVQDEDGIAGPVLALMREAVQGALLSRDALAQTLAATADALAHTRADASVNIQRLTREAASISLHVSEAEANVARLKAENKTLLDTAARERREASERIRDMDGQLEWVRAEREEEAAKSAKALREVTQRLREAETQLAQLKNRKREELKRVMKEKHVLAERLKSAEAARKRFDEELKRFASENVGREEVRLSLENEVRRLRDEVGQSEGGLREKEQQVQRCEAYIDGMESKLHAHQDYIQTLEQSLQEEMARHAPLYGAGLDQLSLQELETLARIHDEGLRQVRAMMQQRHHQQVAQQLSPPSPSPPTPQPPQPQANGMMSGSGHPVPPLPHTLSNGQLSHGPPSRGNSSSQLNGTHMSSLNGVHVAAWYGQT